MTTMVVAFVIELVVSRVLSKSVSTVGPYSNATGHIFGPEPRAWILTGARFTPCMRTTRFFNHQNPVETGDSAAAHISALEELCGFGGFLTGRPDQWFRFILPMFLHGGLFHLLANAFTQYQIAWELERFYGSLRIGFCFFIAGICGFVLGGVCSSLKVVSLGASGSICGLLSMLIVEHVMHWNCTPHPRYKMVFLLLLVVIFVLPGIFPGVDMYSHLGGFVSGILASILVLPVMAVEHEKHPRRRIVRATSGIALAVLLASLLAAFYTRKR